MKRYHAGLIIPADAEPVENGMLLCEDDGTIISVLHPGEAGYETSNAQYFEGALVPGFVNTHLHLELSYLKNCIPTLTGIDGFVEELARIRFSTEDAGEMLQNDREMYLSGIVAAGDICNTAASFPVKTQSSIRYFSFIEVFALRADKAENAFGKGLKLLEEARHFGLEAGITAHAPYSASARLMHKIAEASRDEGYPMSIHFQESSEELEFISTGGGKMAERIKRMGIDISDYQPVEDGPTAWMLKYAGAAKKIIAVHNTWSNPEDVTRLNNGFSEVSFCLCPSANLYIGGKLPSIEFILAASPQICIGTDSLASNSALDMLQEMQILQNNYNLNLKTLIPWTSLHGAKALGIDRDFGSFTKGKKPGIVHLSKVNPKELLILPGCRSRII